MHTSWHLHSRRASVIRTAGTHIQSAHRSFFYSLDAALLLYSVSCDMPFMSYVKNFAAINGRTFNQLDDNENKFVVVLQSSQHHA
ncbi:hypothetical protein Plhal304r1_c046g0126671 [Plasmopara halstedii]